MDRFDRFTEPARKVLELAQEEAQRLNHNYIGTEHILLGLVRSGDGVAAGVFRNLGLDLQKIRSSIEFLIGRGHQTSVGERGLTPRAKRVMELAADEAWRLKQPHIGTEHLLIGLVREGGGMAAAVLESLGASLEKVRDATREALRSSEAGIPVQEEDHSIPGPQPGPALLKGDTELILTMYNYSIWARDRLLTVIESMDEGELRGEPGSGVYGSIFDTLVHTAVSEWMWLQRCQGQPPARLPRGEDFADLRALIDFWNDAQASSVGFIESLDDNSLNQERTYTGPDGKQRTRKIWHMLMQVVNHQTEHRAQIGTMLGQLGKEVPQTDLVVYLSDRTT